MPLSDTAIKNAKATPDKAYKMPDGSGMYLLVHPNGSKYFRLDYRFEGKRKTLALGVYPDVPLKQARERLYTVKQQIADGIDPGENKKAVKQAKAESVANSLEVIASEWIAKKSQDKSDRPLRLLNHLLPYLGTQPIDVIKPKDILACLRRLEV